MSERRSFVTLVIGLLALGSLPPALAFVADASLESVLAVEGALALLLVAGVIAQLRGALTRPLRRALLAFALSAVWAFGALTFQALQEDGQQPSKWFELTHYFCLRGQPETLLDLFLFFLCPLGFLLDLIVSVVRIARWIAELAIPALYAGALAALIMGGYALVQHLRLRRASRHA